MSPFSFLKRPFLSCLVAGGLLLAAGQLRAAEGEGVNVGVAPAGGATAEAMGGEVPAPVVPLDVAVRPEPPTYYGDAVPPETVLRIKPVSEWQPLPPDAGFVSSRLTQISNETAVTALVLLFFVLALIVVYTLRHYYFAFNRLFGRQRHPYVDIDTADWPTVTVFIAAHNEEAVIANSLEALLDVDYPPERIRLMPVNDRSTDRTREIIDSYVVRFPGRITPFHRSGGSRGKSAALKDATELVESDIIIIFDADYVPGKGLIKQLVAPFLDPETGAVMGRVVPLNTGSNLLTRLLDLERSGGYQVDQQARMNLRMVPQYGGTVGGVRRIALEGIGGWRDDALAEDTDLTYRLLLAGWKTIYQNRSECYEEVPESWPVRVRQIMRWAKGHNQAALRYAGRLLFNRGVSFAERVDGLLLLGVYAMSPLLLFGWVLAIFLFYCTTNQWLSGALAMFALMGYGALGNFAAYFEISAAVHLDGNRNRIRLLPLNLFGFLISLLSIARATWNQFFFDWLLRRSLVWDKTVRYRQPGATPVPVHLPAGATPHHQTGSVG